MNSRAFEFQLGKRKCWAQSHPTKHSGVTLYLQDDAGTFSTSISLSPDQARAMALALEAAATHSEATLPTGLGESEAA